ncbi:uncharacterized protein CELE_M70.2 [Caenorhabditis elegans]|uniref:Uncharacterized protein n=1 Tax=Caenorhabditis elegans TaxID=6239 RepID=O45186_CAEEL|nr:Uncharacterized protein CELE_M70.2 [Caenorhabditis elegans]CCD66974.1 Uncharacterized protein CELE_M70.2 [Caenorhabditis elegans]|eukprot:NP_500181.1 Uncharacterized protein CELE_M70.2 [Caenorhabditis elegans]
MTIITTLFTWLICFFLWYASRRFEKKKIHYPSRRQRFVDYLINAQRSEKLELHSQQQFGNRHLGCDELVKSENREKAKSTKKKEKVKSEKMKKATATTGAGSTIDQSSKDPTRTTMASERGMTMTQRVQKEKSIKKTNSELKAAADNQTVTQGNDTTTTQGPSSLFPADLSKKDRLRLQKVKERAVAAPEKKKTKNKE